MRSSSTSSCAFVLLLVNCQSVQTWDDGMAWGEPEPIGNAALESKFVDVAMDPDGNAIAVWIELPVSIASGGEEDIWSNRYSAELGEWGIPEPIAEDVPGPAALHPRVAVDGEGNAVVVWNQSNGTRLDIWSNRYTPGGGWGNPEPIENDDTGNARRPEVAVDTNGNAVAVWYQSDGTRLGIWANRYTPGGAWGNAEVIEDNAAGDALSPQVAVDPDGNAVAVWQQYDGDRDSPETRSNIGSNRYVPGVGWGTDLPLENDNAGDAERPHVAVDASGNAVAVWQQSDATRRFDIWSARYDATSDHWLDAELIEFEDAGDATNPRVAMNPDGNALAVWNQFDGTNDDVWANRYTSGGHWGAPERIETNDAGATASPRVVMAANGNAVAMWIQPDVDGTQPSVWSNRYTPSLGWGIAEVIEDLDRNPVFDRDVAIDPNGNAVAIWSQRFGAQDTLWSCRLESRNGGTRGSGGGP